MPVPCRKQMLQSFLVIPSEVEESHLDFSASFHSGRNDILFKAFLIHIESFDPTTGIGWGYVVVDKQIRGDSLYFRDIYTGTFAGNNTFLLLDFFLSAY